MKNEIFVDDEIILFFLNDSLISVSDDEENLLSVSDVEGKLEGKGNYRDFNFIFFIFFD